MRYKEPALAVLEQLHNNFTQLEYMLRQGASREQVMQWIERCKEKIEQVQTYLNREPQD